MEILRIFEGKLYAFRYDNEEYEYDDDTEYDRLIELWTDVEKLKILADKYSIADVDTFVETVPDNAEEIRDFLDDLENSNEPLETYFQPLSDSERGFKILSLQKGKLKRNKLRLYAIKIDDNCFVITGGAIKLAQTMQEHPETNEELLKLNRAKLFLDSNGIIDKDSFYEYLNN